MLLLEGASLSCVEHGQAALELLEQKGEPAFDIVITDVHMPVMDGYTLASRLREIAPSLPVVGATARAMSDEYQRCLKAGMVAHVAKPIMLDQLVETILTHSRRKPEALSPGKPIIPGLSDDNLDCGDATLSYARFSEDGLNWNKLQEQYQGRDVFAIKLVRVFSEQHGKTPEKLRAAIAGKDFATLKFVSHTVASAFGNLAANTLLEHGREVEQLAAAQDEACFEMAETLAQRAGVFIESLKPWLHRDSSS